MGRLNPGRRAAIKALIAVDAGGYAEEELAKVAPQSGADRGLAWHICLGTLRVQGAIDKALGPHLKTPVHKLDPAVRCALRMGTFECALSRTPGRAAVDQAVEAVRSVGYGRAAGFVNAVMRKMVDVSLDLSPSGNLPGWLQERWRGHEAWLERIQQPARINLAGTQPPRVEGCHPATIGSETVLGLWRLPESIGQVTNIPGFSEGEFWVMDPAAARVADMLDSSLARGSTILDACAAPGGKTFRLSQHGHRLTATDRDEKRLEKMAQNLDRLGLDVAMQRHDWLDGPSSSVALFDAVLVDAPCTALGTVRRHPEILWRRKPGDVAAMSVVQRAVLRNAATHVRQGGFLLYAVCSTEEEEGINVVESLQGWKVKEQWNSVPPRGDEDAFQAFLLHRE